MRELVAADRDELATLLMLRRLPAAGLGAGRGTRRPGRAARAVLVGRGRSRAPGARPAACARHAAGDGARARALRATWQSFSDAAWLPGLHNYWKAEYLAGLDDDGAVAALGALTPRAPSGLSDIKVMHLGGALGRVARARRRRSRIARRGSCSTSTRAGTPRRGGAQRRLGARGVARPAAVLERGRLRELPRRRGRRPRPRGYGEAKYARLASSSAATTGERLPGQPEHRGRQARGRSAGRSSTVRRSGAGDARERRSARNQPATPVAISSGISGTL